MCTNDLAELAWKRIQKAGEKDPVERFDELVRIGLIDKEGRVTKLFGGYAEPDEVYYKLRK